MKRTISLFFALVLALSAVCGASAAEKTFTTPYFTLILPSGWVVDTSEADSAADEDGMQFLGLFYENKATGMVVEACLALYEELSDISLWNSDEAELKAYAESVMEDLEDDDPEYLGVVMVGKIPFVLFKATDEDGEYLYADTMTNGNAIILLAYVEDEKEESRPVTKQYIEQFKSILETFQPVS